MKNYHGFAEVHNTSRDGLEDYKSSGSASLSLGRTPAKQTQHTTNSFRLLLKEVYAHFQADGLAMQQQAAMAGVQPAPIILFTVEEGLERCNNAQRRNHRERFLVSYHLFSLMTIVQAVLTEQQR